MKTILNSRRDRYLAIFSIFLVVVALIAGVVGCNGEEEEEEEEEEEITTWLDLNNIRNDLGGKYVLMNDLDSPANSGSGWEPIGTSTNPFTGTFDGQGNEIRGLFINRPDEDNVGLFGYVEKGGIKNVGLVEADVTGGNHTGALVGYNERGTVGNDPSLPYSTYSTGSVTGSDTVGGLVGCNWDGIVSLCQSSAHIAHAPGESWRAGGLVGANWGNVVLCSYSGDVTGDHEVGGMVGLNGGLVPLSPTGRVISCQGEYTVTGNWIVGGEVGMNLGSLDNAIFKGEVNGALWKATSHIALNEGTTGSSHSSDTAPQGSYVGLLAGWNGGNINNSFAVGSASGNEYVGGVAGYIDYGGTVNGCFAVATVEGTAYLGNLAGMNNGTLANCSSGSAAQMMDIATFLGADWDICPVTAGEVNTACQWNIVDGQTYPFLSGIAADFAPTIPCKNAGMFVQMTIGDPETLDPAAAYDTASGEQIGYVYEPLIMYKGTEAAVFEPVLATEWTWSDADLTWRFKIRKNVKFHEGGTLTPEDVEYSFERAMIYDRLGGPMWMFFEPLLLAGEYAGLTFADVDAAVEVDGDWVVFTLADAGYKLAWLQTIANSWGSILDKEWCVANGDWDGTEADAPNHYQVEDGATYLWTHMNGTGPWKLEEWEPGVQIKLMRNDNYWREPAPFERVTTQVVEEWTTRKLALLAGDADLVYVPRMYIGELAGIEDLNAIKDLPELAVDSFSFNLAIASTSAYDGSGQLDGQGIPGDFFADEDVRKGFCYAFDYDTYLEEAMLGEGILNGSPVVKGLYGYNPNASKYTLDLAKATEHFKKAFGGQVWEKGFKFTMLYNAGNEVRKVACEILQENLYKINPKFQVVIQPLDWRTGILPLIKTKDATVWQIGWMADYPHAHNFVVPFMATYGTFAKFQSYGSAALDAKISAALLETDPAKQLQKYYELQDIWYNDAPGIVLVQPAGRRYFTKCIHGFYFNPMIPGLPGPLYYMSKSSS